MDFNDRDIQYIWDRINPEFYGMILETISDTSADGVIKADGVKIHKEDFKRKIKLIINDRIKEKNRSECD